MLIEFGRRGVLTLHLPWGQGHLFGCLLKYCMHKTNECSNGDHNHTCHICHEYDILAQALILERLSLIWI